MKMKKHSKYNTIQIFRYFVVIIFISNFTLLQNISAQDDIPLNLDQVEVALRSAKATAATKNSLLIAAANERKITFLLTPEIEKRLRLFGATPALITTLRTNAPTTLVIQKSSSNTTVKNSLGMEFVLIPKGEFMMGTKDEEKGYDFDKHRPRHKVTLNQDFYIGKYEVTQAQWKSIMVKNPSTFDLCGENCPVETISWNDAKKFIEKLNLKNDGYKYRLPTEAEWEYSARGGTETSFYWGNDLEEKDYKYYASSNHSNPVRVGSFLPNGFGLYDMSGNVWEMCEDVWTANYKNSPGNGSANLAGETEKRVMRGGGYGNHYDERRSDMRRFFTVNDGNYGLGFRLIAIPLKP